MPIITIILIVFYAEIKIICRLLAEELHSFKHRYCLLIDIIYTLDTHTHIQKWKKSLISSQLGALNGRENFIATSDPFPFAIHQLPSPLSHRHTTQRNKVETRTNIDAYSRINFLGSTNRRERQIPREWMLEKSTSRWCEKADGRRG